MPQQPSNAPQFVGVTGAPAESGVDLLFIPIFGRQDTLEDVPGAAAAAGGELRRAIEAGEFKAAVHETLVVAVTGGGWRARRFVFLGAGDRAEIDAERARRLAATASYAARQRASTSVGFVARGLAPAIVADGLSAAEFDGGTYRSDRADRPAFPARVEIIVPGGDAAGVSAEVRRGRIIGQCANVARELANEPGNVLTPRTFADRISTVARDAGLAVEVLDEERIHALGMRLLMAVARGSAEPPRLVVLRHDPPGAPSAPVLAFVGKGVTFDSGGISIKPADGMDRMKDDMSGGAAVAAAMRAIALLGGRHRVIGLVPTTENMPGGRAVKPGDVVVGASGTSVEIINTDAEGRLILADALWYARQLGATHIVDVATLTGACIVALGRYVSGLFGRPAEWVDTVRAAAVAAGDRVWPMPIYEEAAEEIRSEIADIVNAAGRPGGAVTAAAFLERFAGEGAWAHLDIAGPAWAETKQPHQPKGATGVAVRLLTQLAMTGGSQAAT